MTLTTPTSRKGRHALLKPVRKRHLPNLHLQVHLATEAPVTDGSLPTRQPNLTRYAWLSIAAALVNISLKYGAYLVTHSVALLSIAAEGLVNLSAAIVALIALHLSSMRPDIKHQYGRGKAEYFSAAIESTFITIAGVSILLAAMEHLVAPNDLQKLGVGLAVTVVAAVLNGVVGMIQLRAGRRYHSMTLTTDGRHLLTDLITSAGMVLGLLLVMLTGWRRLDAILGLVVATNIILTGLHLLSASSRGLLDGAVAPDMHAKLIEALRGLTTPDVVFHGLRTREAGRLTYVSLHLTVPADWPVERGYAMFDEVEKAVRQVVTTPTDVVIRLEPAGAQCGYLQRHGPHDISVYHPNS